MNAERRWRIQKIDTRANVLLVRTATVGAYCNGWCVLQQIRLIEPSGQPLSIPVLLGPYLEHSSSVILNSSTRIRVSVKTRGGREMKTDRTEKCLLTPG